MHLNGCDGLTGLCVDEQLRGQVVTDVLLVRNLNDVAIGGVFFVTDFADYAGISGGVFSLWHDGGCDIQGAM